MSLCKGRIKISYSFQNKKNKIFETEEKISEILVEQKPKNSTENYSGEGFLLGFYSPNNNRSISVRVRDYVLFHTNFPYIPEDKGLSWWPCEGSDFNRNADGSFNGPTARPSTIVRDYSMKCPSPKTGDCWLVVKNFEGRIIFRDKGECPCNYSYKCLSCPPGTCECQHKNRKICCINPVTGLVVKTINL